MSYMQEYEKWLASPALNEQEHAELESIRDDEKEIRERFYGPLEFGTAGLRGTMKVGLHQMNIHVIRWATQGFANVICAEGEEAKRWGVALCMDCRNHSMEFARAAAEVCAANGIHVRIFESLRPTPELSFAVREYDCQAGINVTASHNPKEYNGYKVYWSDGAQLPPQHAAAIARELEQIDIFTGIRRMEFDDAKAQGLIEIMGAETDERFMSHVMAMVNDRESRAKGPPPPPQGPPPPPRGGRTGAGGSAGSGREASALRSGADGAGRQLPHGGLPQSGEPGGLLSGHSVGGQGGRRLYSGHRPGQRPGGHHGSQPGRLLHPRHRQPDRRSDAGLPHRGHAPGRQAAGASLLPQDHRHHGDGPEGGRGQRRHLLRYLHRLQVHGGEEEPAGVSGAGPCDHEL